MTSIQRPDVPSNIWQTAMIPDSSSTGLYPFTQTTPPSFTDDAVLRDAVQQTLLHAPYHSPYSYIKYNPSISYFNKFNSLSDLADDHGNPFDLPSFHPRAFSTIVSTPRLFRPVSHPIFQPFSFSSLNPIGASTFAEYSSSILNAQTICPNPYPNDGLSLPEFHILQHAILSAIKALVDSYPLPRQVLTLSRAILYLLLNKYPIYSFGPLHFIPSTIVYVATKFFELTVKPTDLFTKYNNFLQQPFPIAPLSTTPQPNFFSLWFQEFLPPYIFPIHSSEEDDFPNPSYHLDQLVVLKYLHQLSHLLYQTRLVQESNTPVQLPHDQFELYQHNSGTLPPPLLFADQTSSSTFQTSSTIMNSGLNGHTFNESWLQYLSSINFSYATSPLSHTHPQYTPPTPVPQITPSDSPLAHNGSILFQFLLLSLFFNIPEAIATASVPVPKASGSTSKSIITLTNKSTASSSSSPSLLPPSLILLDALIIDTLNFKALSIASTPLVDLSLALLDRCKITLPLGYTVGDEVPPFVFSSSANTQTPSISRLFPDKSTTSASHLSTQQLSPMNDGNDENCDIDATPKSPKLSASPLQPSSSTSSLQPPQPHTQTQQEAVEELIALLPPPPKRFIPNTALDEIPEVINIPLLEFGLESIDSNRYNIDDILQFYPNLANNNTLLHLASFISAIASYAESLPLQLFYPQQIISIAILDLALCLLQLPPPQLLPNQFHSSHSHPLIAQNSIPSIPSISAPKPTPATTNSSSAHFTDHILTPHYTQKIANQFKSLWDINTNQHAYIQNGMIKRPFTLNSPFASSSLPHTPYDTPTTQISFWYHHIVPGLDPAILQSIAVTILEGTKLGHIVVQDTPNAKLTLRVLAQQRYPWFHSTTNNASILAQFNSLSHFDTFLTSHQRFHNLGMVKMIDVKKLHNSDLFSPLIGQLKDQSQCNISSRTTPSIPILELVDSDASSSSALNLQLSSALEHSLLQLPVLTLTDPPDSTPNRIPSVQTAFQLLPSHIQLESPTPNVSLSVVEKVTQHRSHRRAMILQGQFTYTDLLHGIRPNQPRGGHSHHDHYERNSDRLNDRNNDRYDRNSDRGNERNNDRYERSSNDRNNDRHSRPPPQQTSNSLPPNTNTGPQPQQQPIQSSVLDDLFD